MNCSKQKLGSFLKEERERRKLNQAAVARAAGISVPTLSRWEKAGVQKIDYEKLERICDFLGVSLVEALKNSDEEEEIRVEEVEKLLSQIQAALNPAPQSRQVDALRLSLKKSEHLIKSIVARGLIPKN